MDTPESHAPIPAGATSDVGTWTAAPTCIECSQVIPTSTTQPATAYTVHITGPGVDVHRDLCTRCAQKYWGLIEEE